MKNLELIIPKFNPPTMSVGGVVAPPVLPQAAPISSVSTSSSLGEFDWGSAILTCLAIGAGLYFLNKKMEAKGRGQEYGY
tara:strand:- start:276 stop:515 length:240 start_codon:yes stop_codon:yes gene_type:complete